MKLLYTLFAIALTTAGLALTGCQGSHFKSVSSFSSTCGLGASRVVTLAWAPTAEAPQAKTYVAFDVDDNGVILPTGRGHNGNLGWSAQVGASSQRPPADTTIEATIPDASRHLLAIYALDSDGYTLPTSPLTQFEVNGVTCQFQ